MKRFFALLLTLTLLFALSACGPIGRECINPQPDSRKQ